MIKENLVIILINDSLGAGNKQESTGWVTLVGGGSPKATTPEASYHGDPLRSCTYWKAHSQHSSRACHWWAQDVPRCGAPQLEPQASHFQQRVALSVYITYYQLLWRPGCEKAREALPKATSVNQICTDPGPFALLHLSVVKGGHKGNNHKPFVYVYQQSTNG